MLHKHGKIADEVGAHIRWYEERIKHVIALAEERYDEVRVFAFSDHGMTDIHATCDVKGRIEGLGLEFGVDYVAAYDSTMARFWFLKDGARAPITEALEQEAQGRILSDDQLAEWGCDFPGRKYGELFFLMNPGVLLCPSFMGEKPLAGMHGFAPEDKDSVAAFMSNVKLESPPKRLDDLYWLMRDEAAEGRAARDRGKERG